MTEITEPAWAVIWTCVVDRQDNEPSLTLHSSLANVVAELRREHDPNNEFTDVPISEFLLLLEIEHNMFLQVRPLRVDVAKFQRIDEQDWRALAAWEEEPDNV